jgi:hypothetical protein
VEPGIYGQYSPIMFVDRSWLLQAYEDEHMKPSKDAQLLAERALNHISNRVPDIFGLRVVARSLFTSMLDEKLRIAMG